MSKNQYRIIYFWDNRYNMERYYISKGDFRDAIAAAKELEAQPFTDYVSKYYPIDSHYVFDINRRSSDNIRLKPTYNDLRSEKFWK